MPTIEFYYTSEERVPLKIFQFKSFNFHFSEEEAKVQKVKRFAKSLD